MIIIKEVIKIKKYILLGFMFGILLICLGVFVGQLNAINNANLIEKNKQTNTYTINFNSQ